MATSTASAGVWQLAWRRFKRDRVGMLSLAVVLFYILIVVLAAFGVIASDWQVEKGVSYANPAFAPHLQNQETQAAAQTVTQDPAALAAFRAVDPLAADYARIEQQTQQYRASDLPRSATLAFGGDQWGRSVLAKMIQGAKISIYVGLVAALIATLIGTVLGALAGYLGRWVNDLCEWVYNVFTSIPYILLILAFAAVLGRGILTIVLILGLTGWTGIYRLVRAEYLKHANREYVRAAQTYGASHWRRMFVHILPNIGHILLVQLSLHVVYFIKAEVILSFLGFGVPVDAVSWGTMLNEAQTELVIGKWWQFVGAGFLSMAVFVTAFSLLTDAMRDALDPKLQ